jgi:hypothetical protein
MKRFASLLLLIAMAFASCKGTHKTGAADKKPASTKPAEENTEADFEAFVNRLRKAVSAHDMNTLATMMTADFGYSLNPVKQGPGVYQFWDENDLWPEVEGIVNEKFLKKGEFWVSPPQFADESLNYTGYRAGIRRVNGSWKFAYFVNG